MIIVYCSKSAACPLPGAFVLWRLHHDKIKVKRLVSSGLVSSRLLHAKILQHPCKPKLLRWFCSLCSSHNIDLWICLLPPSAFPSFLYLTCAGHDWISKAAVNLKVSSSQPPWWPNRGSQLKNRNKIIIRKMKGYIHLKLDVQMKRYVEASQNE